MEGLILYNLVSVILFRVVDSKGSVSCLVEMEGLILVNLVTVMLFRVMDYKGSVSCLVEVEGLYLKHITLFHLSGTVPVPKVLLIYLFCSILKIEKKKIVF